MDYVMFFLFGVLPMILCFFADEDSGDRRYEHRYTKRQEGDGFYWSPEWRTLRTRVIAEDGRVCRDCGTYAYGPYLHVDHIRPRSKYPGLALTRSNLQILCKDCNMRKGNH